MSSRPPVFTWNEDLHFGPPSEPVHIQKFLEEAERLSLCGTSPWLDGATQGTSKDHGYNAIAGWKDWQELSEEARALVEMDCKVDDIKSSLSAILKSHRHVAYLQNTHAAVLGAFNIPGVRKGKKKQPVKEPGLEPIKQAVEHTPLKMWRLEHAAKPYIRTGRVSDQNALEIPQQQPKRPGVTSVLSHEVLITITAYTRNTWYPYAFTRTCQHVLSSSCTLAELWSCISCDFNGDGSMPNEVLEFDEEDGTHYSNDTQRRARVIGYEFGDRQSDPDPAVIVIEDTAYCDGRGSPDYVDKLFSHLAIFKPPPPDPHPPLPLPPGPYERPKRSSPLQKGLPFHAVSLRSLTLRVNEPYWTLHRGICEHWFVVDEIRLQNPRDPTTGYPIAIQRTPTSRPLCRICSKVPAKWSIINDVRLDESPAMVCQPCWQLFGNPPPPTQQDGLNAGVVGLPLVVETL